jgi:hypothetical protein
MLNYYGCMAVVIAERRPLSGKIPPDTAGKTATMEKATGIIDAPVRSLQMQRI